MCGPAASSCEQHAFWCQRLSPRANVMRCDLVLQSAYGEVNVGGVLRAGTSCLWAHTLLKMHQTRRWVSM